MTVHEGKRMQAAGAEREPAIIESGGTARLHLTLAVTDYDHVRDLVNGAVQADGMVLTAFVLPVEEIFFRFIKNQEWDVSEMSFGKFIGYAAQGNSPFIGIPVFPSRVFRHSAFYVRADRGIKSPKDLEGKSVGIPEWAQTAGMYARGYLSETAGVDLEQDQMGAGRHERGRARGESGVQAAGRHSIFAAARHQHLGHAAVGRDRRCALRRACRTPSRRAAARSCGSIRTIASRRCAITKRPAFSRSCM